MRLILPVPDDFDFRNAVTSHGFFVLAPNRWNPACCSLETTITLDATTAATVLIRESSRRRITISSNSSFDCSQRQVIKKAVVRMLRLDEDLAAFHARCRASATHAKAAEMRFGRLLRSGSLFEDMVKVICTCNVTWSQTVRMVDAIVSRWGVSSDVPGRRSFPTFATVAILTPEELRTHARVGYRAVSLHRLAQEATGVVDLESLDTYAGPTEDLVRQLRHIHGIGDYAAGHLCMLLGRYDRLAIDTEMLRFLKSRHPRRRWTAASIRQYYRPWQPFQFLAYWFELWQDYTHRHGPADQWDPTTTGVRITE